MLEELRITSLGVIDESVLELGPGFTAITGETGAGKTMVVTALGLLLGGRADSTAVRTGAKSARVEGVVSTTASLRAAIEELGGHSDDDLLLVRQVFVEGRSRAYLGGAAVPVARLSELAAELVAVHGQSDQHRLLRAAAQREALDAFGGPVLLALRADYLAGYAELKAVRTELAEVVATSRERAREADLLRFGLQEISALSPEAGEDAALAEEESRLGFADTLRTTSHQAREALSSEMGSPDLSADARDALGAIATSRRLLDGVRDHDSAAAELADRLAELSYLLSDLAADLTSYSQGLQADPVRLAVVSERRAALASLTRKYGATIDEVLAWAAQSRLRLDELDGTDERIDLLTGREKELTAELTALALRLSDARSQAGRELAEIVTVELTQLAMPHARLTVSVTQEDPLQLGPYGADEVELLLAANVGAEPRPLDKGASGGELSRVMLAIEVALAATNPVPTFVFDEVDAGVGGKAAVEVGRRLAQLAQHAQVIAVTHLPQVAAFADTHVSVTKSQDGIVTTSGLQVLDDAERLRELSRMLAGLEDSETALAHARELLDEAQARPGSATR
ncbi:MAG: DNA repair protein RecN [Nocardioidaceae bacterium]|nr:MAG: DNA repair protein RecN [Nocardioidaceae bacterium]